MAVKPIPDGYESVIPYLIVDDAAKAIDFYTTALDAKETVRMDGPDGKVGHAEMKIGGSIIMLADEFPDMGAKGPKSIGGSPVSLVVYFKDADATFAKSLQAGATEVEPVEVKFYGDRMGAFDDPFGHRWHVATHVEDVSPEAMEKRAAAAMQET